MTSIFQELLHEETLANYMDDFVIPAKTEKKLEELARSVKISSVRYRLQVETYIQL